MQFASLSPDTQDRTATIYAFGLTNHEQKLWNAASSGKRSAFIAAISNENLSLRSCERNRLRVVISSSIEAEYDRPASRIQEALERAFDHLK